MSALPSLELLDQIANENVQSRGFTPRLIRARAKALNALIPPGVVLDLGCADGLLTQGLARHHRKVVAVDASALRVARTQEATCELPVEVRQAYFEDFAPRPDERFDAVVLSCILEHLDDPVALLKRCRSWLAPGGVVGVIVPNGESVHRRAGVHMGLLPSITALGEADDALDHKRVYTADSLDAELEAAGLRVTRRTGVYFKPLPNRAMAALEPALLDAYEALGSELPQLAAELVAIAAA